MDVREAPVSESANTNSLVHGTAWAGLTLTFSFPTSAALFTGYTGGEPASNFEVLNATQQAVVRGVFASLSTFSGLTFSELTGADAASAVLRFGMTDDTPTAHAYLPSTTEAGGDSWFRNSGGYYDNPQLGNYAYLTFMHEIGHALGLGHPHESTPPMSFESDWMPNTVMSYRSRQGGPLETGYTNEDWGFAQSYMMEDIAALQFLYGANFNHNASDSVYRWSPQTGEMSINGVGQGAPGANRVFQTLWDGGGNDTFDFSNYPANPFAQYTLMIDLRPGQLTGLPIEQRPILDVYSVGNIANSLLYNNDPRSLIENVIGSPGGELINGNAIANQIDGGLGYDEIHGHGGNDTLAGELVYGGDGNDVIHGQTGPARLFGEAGDDRLYGSTGHDNVSGGAGDDWIDGGTGGDFLDGGAGSNTIYGHEGNDHLRGGDGADHLDGGVGDDRLDGGSGNDVLLAGDGGDTLDGGLGVDQLAGGPGNDLYFLYDADQAIELPGQGIDTVWVVASYTAPDAIENISLDSGPYHDVVLTGNASSNVILGGAWDEIIDGRAGADEMRGQSGDDTYYVDDLADVVIEDDRELGGFDTIYSSVSHALAEYAVPSPLPPGNPLHSGRMSWSNQIELLVLTGSGSLAGTGNSLVNRIDGNAGNNALAGLAGNDTLNGAAGNDTLTGGAGDDTLDGGANFDVAVFAGNRADYAITTEGAVTRVAGPDGTDSLRNIERLQFTDLSLELASATSFLPLSLRAFGATPDAGGWNDDATYPRMLADVNGDGRADLVGFGSGGVHVALATGGGNVGEAFLAVNGFGAGPEGGSWTDTQTYPRTFADVNGDGLADLVGFGSGGVHVALATGNGLFGTAYLAINGFGAGPEGGNWNDNLVYRRLVTDINGDGMADIVGFGSGGVRVALAAGGGEFSEAYIAVNGFGAGPEGGSWTNVRVYPRAFADVNGDGLADLVGFGSGGVHVALGIGGGQFAQAILAVNGFGAGPEGGSWTDNDTYKRTLADINGDGRADIVGFGSAGAAAALAQPNGTFASTYLASPAFGAEDGWVSDDQYYRTLADIDGDGKADLVGFGDSGVYFARGNGHGGFAAAELAIATFGSSHEAGNWGSQEASPRWFADLNGDGADDIVGFGGAGVYAALSGTDWPLV